MRRSKIVFGVALAVLAAVICVECLWPDNGLPRPQALSDGSVFAVKAISFGANHSYSEPPAKPWQLAIGKRLPYPLAARLGWRRTVGTLSINDPNGAPSLVIFATRDGTGKLPSDSLGAAVLDDQGNSLGWVSGSGSTGNMDKAAHYDQLQQWFIPAYPRRAKTLIVRFLWEQGQGKPEAPIMQFHITNPQPGGHPAWTPELWPVSKDAGGIAVTLTDFVTGLSKSEPARAAARNEEPITRLTLGLEAKGQTNCPWQPNLITISDAAGNHWDEDLWGIKTNVGPQGVTLTMNFSGNLWPGESAWKLRVEFAPTPDVPPEDVVALTGIALPPAGSNAPLSLSTNIGGLSLHLTDIKTEQPNGQAKPSAVLATISYIADEMPDGGHLTLMKATDEQGRRISIESSEALLGVDSFKLTVPTNAVSLNCTFGLRKSRFVEFIANPRRLKAGGNR